MTKNEWVAILKSCAVRTPTADKWAEVFSAEITDDTFSGGLSEIDDFLGQILHESSYLERLEEGLNYSAERLCQVWPSRFKNTSMALPYSRNPTGLANFVYAGRLGNTEAGDGYKYRGRGLIQVTGKANYAALSEKLGVDLVEDPDLMLDMNMALRASIAWWEGNIPDGILGDVVRVTKRVNGGSAGLNERKNTTLLAGKAIDNL